jgi:hypothetical protein
MNWSEAMRLTCPRCGAPASAPCKGSRGQDRTALHRERYAKPRRPRATRCNTPGWVYFMAASGTGHIKIGYSQKAPADRLKSLQTGSSHELTIVGLVRGTRREEQEYHRLFAELHVRGEWFRDEGALRRLLDGLLESVPA